MPTIISMGGAGMPVSDYEALLTEYVTLQSQYNSLNTEYNNYKNSHSHTNEEYEAHDIVRTKKLKINCNWYGGDRGHEIYVDGTKIGNTGPNEQSRTLYYTVTL